MWSVCCQRASAHLRGQVRLPTRAPEMWRKDLRHRSVVALEQSTAALCYLAVLSPGHTVVVDDLLLSTTRRRKVELNRVVVVVVVVVAVTSDARERASETSSIALVRRRRNRLTDSARLISKRAAKMFAASCPTSAEQVRARAPIMLASPARR